MTCRSYLACLLALLLWCALPGLAQEQIPSDRIDGILQLKPLVLDVRTAEEIAEFGTLPGALTIPEGEVESRLSEIPRDRLILVA